MKLEIDDSTQVLSYNFISWLTNQITQYIISSIDPSKLIRWNIYFNTQKMYISIYKKKILAEDIIKCGAANLHIIEASNKYYIEINPNIYTPGFNQIQVNTLCKLINYGNQEISSYPIFTEAFKHFADNITNYLDEYKLFNSR